MITFFKDKQYIIDSLKNNQGLLLDFDNTLLDPVPTRTYSLTKLFKEAQIPENEIEVAIKVYEKINNYYWKSVEQGIFSTDEMQFKRFEDFSKQYQVIFSPEVMNRKYLEYFSESTTIEQNVMDTLQKLKSMGIKLVIITNGFQNVQETRIKSSGLLNIINEYFTSESVGAPKPNPKMFIEAKNYLESINCSTNDLWVVGDTYNADIKGAINAGFNSCWLNTNYSKDKVHFTENNGNPTIIVDNFLEFIELYMKAKGHK